MTFDGTAKWFWSETSYIELIALYVHPKNSNHLRSHSRAIMALHHSRFKGWKTKQAEFFALDKFTLQNLSTNLGVCKPTCLYFLCITSEVKQYYLSYRPRKECSISQFFKTNCTQSIFRTINHGLLAKTFTVKKFPKSPIRPAGSHIWRAPNLQWTLIELLFNVIKYLTHGPQPSATKTLWKS